MKKHRTQPAIGAAGAALPGEALAAYRWLENTAVRVMGTWENLRGVTPDDLAQEAWLDYLRLRDRGREHGHAVRTAAHTVRQNYIDLIRRDETASKAYPHDPGQDSTPDVFAPDFVDWLADQLSDRELEAVFLRYERDLPVAEVAREMGVHEEMVKTLLRRVNPKLRGRLTRTGDILDGVDP